MSASERSEPNTGSDGVIRGPHLWLNWQAMLHGQPARTSSRSEHSPVILPLWEEYSLYSDARIAGEVDLGPYRLIMDFGWPASGRIGRPDRQLVLRVYDHLLDEEPGPERPVEFAPNLAGWTGGDIGDQMAAVLSLALFRRVRSSGVSRQCFDDLGDQHGVPCGPDLAPLLGEPKGRPMLPEIAHEARVELAQSLLKTYANVSSGDAAVLTRAAGQYADAVWWADADPRISWIKLVGALETAANCFDTASAATPVELLKRHRGKLYGALKRAAPEAVELVADDLAGLLNAQAKMVDFTLRHVPDPPERRPTVGQFDFRELETALRMIYHHRSRDLHDGIPFPAPMCEPPMVDEHGIAQECMPFLAASSRGGTWKSDEELPMYLHFFAYLVGGALSKWWAGLRIA
jgi:hypothetical protein